MPQPTLLEQGVAAVKRDAPQSFTVGAHADIVNKRGDATLTYDRKWSNGWGATAYLKGWWNDTAVVPVERAGLEVGGKLEKKF